MKDRITHERLLQRLRFDADIGALVWLSCPDVGEEFNRTMPGRRAGSIDKDGHYRITVDGLGYNGPELLWFYFSREWPKVRRAQSKRKREPVARIKRA
ncbi:hypothetical protein [Rhizobium mayense]|uniref:hypothetical protein n=1 Tax=Rhizobium mayense TaxID=1312184 RepID=UPI00398C4C6F